MWIERHTHTYTVLFLPFNDYWFYIYNHSIALYSHTAYLIYSNIMYRSNIKNAQHTSNMKMDSFFTLSRIAGFILDGSQDIKSTDERSPFGLISLLLATQHGIAGNCTTRWMWNCAGKLCKLTQALSFTKVSALRHSSLARAREMVKVWLPTTTTTCILLYTFCTVVA